MWICAGAQAASARAWLDRNTMQLGETVTLNVQVEGDAQARQPDFSALAGDFDMTGTQSSTSVNIVNGKTSSSVLWAVGLSPRHTGTFTIPALNVAGQHTQPLTLVVSPPSANAAQPGGDVFVEAQADPLSPYVQQQVLLTVKLYFAVNLVDGNLDDPQVKGAVVRKLGQDSRYSAQVGGRSYNVVERHYALTPEQNGTLSVPPIVFRGHSVDPNGGGFFFNQGRAIGAQSSAIALNVRPRPAASGNDTWLPARSMSLTATGIDASTRAQVGEPLTLTLRLEAQGLGFEQLPKLELPSIDGADIYPDKPVTQDKDDGQWLYGVRERKFAIVPNRSGPLTLPPISIVWWDTAHDSAQTTQVPSITLNVQPAAGGNGTSAPPIVQSTQLSQLAQAAVAPKTSSAAPAFADTTELRLWRTAAFVAIALWASTLLAWIAWLLARRGRQSFPASTLPVPDPTSVRRAFIDACKREDLPAAGRALLAWARQSRPELRNLGELARAVSDPGQSAAIVDLQRTCFGAGGQNHPSGSDLYRSFAGGPVFRNTVKTVPIASHLPDLYPADS
ncbi:MAG: protein BatD [Xanthomonadaceae bacterium]|nr:protein BatD [Xanthomonadaceae bacterium]